MQTGTIVYFDIAAVVIMMIALASLLFRKLTHGAANRVYLTCMVLVTVTALCAVVGEALDALLLRPLMPLYPVDTNAPLAVRSAFTTIYYALRVLTAPAYLVLIATVSDTSHRLDSSNFRRVFLWVPMVLTVLIVLTNPLHHLVFFYENGFAQREPLICVLYFCAIYYSLIGIAWLIRWRELLDPEELSTLMLLYPIMLAAAAIQYELPALRLEMFVTSIAMMLVSAFVIHPETRRDAMVNAASLHSYNEMTYRAFITDKPLCLAFVEIVNREKLRELLGKHRVQAITREVADMLTTTLEHDDTLYYLRNGLFCIATRNIDVEHALRIAKNTHEAGKARSETRMEKAAVTQMRTCIVRIPEDISDTETLVSFERRFGHLVPQSTVVTYGELAARDDFELQMKLSDILEHAIDNKSFEIHYQPIYCLRDGCFHSAEALVRLKDKRFGWIAPSLFIPEAEASGAILDIGSILLEKICAFLGRIDFSTTGLAYIEANLSVDQCVRPELADEILGLLEKNDVEPARLNLEVTETSAMYSQQAIDENVKKLAAAGITLSLDDYGVGYSNMGRMIALPFSLVKIDKSFVDALDDSATRTILASAIDSIKQIGKEVLIEGVETEEQAQLLAKMGADFIQGYHYAKPLPEDKFIEFMQEHRRT